MGVQRKNDCFLKLRVVRLLRKSFAIMLLIPDFADNRAEIAVKACACRK